MEELLAMCGILVAVAACISGGIGLVLWVREQFKKRRAKSPISYQPRGDRVLVKRHEHPPQAEGELALPASQQKPLDEGSVIAVGPEVAGISSGDHVCFLEFAGTDVWVDGESYLSMRDEEVHGKRDQR